METTAKIDNVSGVRLLTKDKRCIDNIVVRPDSATISSLKAKNIKKGVTICGVTGVYDGTPVDYSDQTNLEKVGQTIMNANARVSPDVASTFFETRGIPAWMQKITPIGGAPRIMASRVINGAAGLNIGEYYRVTEAEDQRALVATSALDYFIAYDDDHIYFGIRDIGGFENSIEKERYAARNNYAFRFGLDTADYSRTMVIQLPYTVPSSASPPNLYKVAFFDSKRSANKLTLDSGVIERMSSFKTSFGEDIDGELTTDFTIIDWNATVQTPDKDCVVEGNTNYWKPYVLYAKYVINKASLLRYWNQAFGTSISLSNKLFIASSCSCYVNDGSGSLVTMGTPFYGTVLNSEEIEALGKRCPILPDVIVMN